MEPAARRQGYLVHPLVEEDPELTHPRNERVRTLLDTRWGERLKMFRVG